MTDNVIILPVITRLDLPPERSLNDALEADLKGVIVVGIHQDGSHYLASSLADGAAAMWLLEWAKLVLLKEGGCFPD